MLRVRRITHSLAAKLFAAIFVVLLLSLGVLGYANIRLHREHLEAAQLRSAERMSDIVRRSMTYHMLRNDRDALRHIIETIGAEPGITRLRITDHRGTVRFVTAEPTGGRVLSVNTPIENSHTCSSGACHAHPESQKVLGLLELDFSLAGADADARRTSLQFLLSSALAIAVILGVLVAAFQIISRELARASATQMIHAEKMTSLGKLAAVVAHEINNPLSGILTYARLLRKWIERGDDLAPHARDMAEALQLIESESKRCGDIVRNLLTFAREQPLNIVDVDVNKLVNQCIKLVEHKLELGDIEPDLELASGLPPVRGDSGQIEQLFLALIMNAIEAMPREGCLRIVTAPKSDHGISITIEDNGTGIDPEILPRLFVPFTTTKEEGKGVGLGLAISKAIVDRHKGTIAVKSEVGKGTTFTIVLPAAQLQKEAA